MPMFQSETSAGAKADCSETEAKLSKASPLVIKGPQVGNGQLFLVLSCNKRGGRTLGMQTIAFGSGGRARLVGFQRASKEGSFPPTRTRGRQLQFSLHGSSCCHLELSFIFERTDAWRTTFRFPNDSWKTP